MIRSIVISFLLFGAVVSNADQSIGQVEQAKLTFFEKFYGQNSELLTRRMKESGIPEAEIDDRLYDAINTMAGCMITEIRAQAIEQGLPVDIVLEAFGDGAKGKERAKVALQLDSDALNQRSKHCSEALMADLGIEPYVNAP